MESAKALRAYVTACAERAEDGVAQVDCDTLMGLVDEVDREFEEATKGVVRLPSGRDGVPIDVGSRVYGGDGELWDVLHVTFGAEYDVTLTDGRRTKSVRANALYTDRTAMAAEVIRSAISESGGEPLGEEWLTDVARRALDIRGAE